METILYFYSLDNTGNQEKGKVPLKLERIGQQNYSLVRVGVQKQCLREWEQNYQQILSLQAESELLSQRKGMRDKVRGRKKRKQGDRECRRIWDALHRSAENLAETVCPLVDSPNECCYVYEDGMEQTVFAKLWQQHCSFIELRAEDYSKSPWVEELLAMARYDHYIILGSAQALLKPLWQRAAHMKTLQWFISGRQYKEELETFVEDLFMEYGLAADVQLLEGEEEYHKRLLKSARPVNVLDFTGETKLKLSGLAEGSCVLDMNSVREKRRQIEERGLPVLYFSMKKQWREWQNRPATLDTTHKNRYNTLVNQGNVESPGTENMDLDNGSITPPEEAGHET